MLVVDDHDLFRTGLVSLLDAEADLEVVAQASSGRRGVRLSGELHPDVVLMDLRMPDIDGAQATRKILESQPAPAVIVFTIVTGEEEVRAALEAGACGFVAKETSFRSLVSAIRAAAEGAAWFSPRAAEVVLRRIQDARIGQPNRAPEELSARELEVLQLIARGMSNPDIAKALGISSRTVKNHVSSILAKLRLPSRVQAAVYAVRSGLD